MALMANTSMAVTLPSHHTESKFSGIGTVDFIDLNEGTIVIGDRFFLLHEDVIIHSSLRQHDNSKHKLKTGKEAAYKLAAGNGNRQLISKNGKHQWVTEIWLLPKGYIEKHRRNQND